MERKPTVGILFCGCGGEALGFRNAGFKIVWANDNDKWSCETFKANFPEAEVVCKDIGGVKDFPNVDVITGGYPCQGFSLAGPRLVTDPRNYMYLEFAKCLKAIQPKFFMAENVKGLLTLGKGKIVKAMIREFAEIGYNVKYKLPNAKDYGVPQDRERVIIVGVRKDLDYFFEFPEPTHGPKSANHTPYVTLRKAIGSLKNMGEHYNTGFSSRYMSRNRRKEWDDVSYTIPAMARQVPLHPSSGPMVFVKKDLWKFLEGYSYRRLSWKECAIIQSFARNFKLKGPLVEKYKQIGNAVPPLLSQRVAENIMPFFKGQKQPQNLTLMRIPVFVNGK